MIANNICGNYMSNALYSARYNKSTFLLRDASTLFTRMLSKSFTFKSKRDMSPFSFRQCVQIAMLIMATVIGHTERRRPREEKKEKGKKQTRDERERERVDFSALTLLRTRGTSLQVTKTRIHLVNARPSLVFSAN